MQTREDTEEDNPVDVVFEETTFPSTTAFTSSSLEVIEVCKDIHPYNDVDDGDDELKHFYIYKRKNCMKIYGTD
jgi:hypothetical protein